MANSNGPEPSASLVKLPFNPPIPGKTTSARYAERHWALLPTMPRGWGWGQMARPGGVVLTCCLYPEVQLGKPGNWGKQVCVLCCQYGLPRLLHLPKIRPSRHRRITRGGNYDHGYCRPLWCQQICPGTAQAKMPSSQARSSSQNCSADQRRSGTCGPCTSHCYGAAASGNGRSHIERPSGPAGTLPQTA